MYSAGRAKSRLVTLFRTTHIKRGNRSKVSKWLRGESNSKLAPTVAYALREVSEALALLADTLDKADLN